MSATETHMGTGIPGRDPVHAIGGRYRLERLLGGGGCGLVYAARHDTLDKPVAIKVMRAELVRDLAQAQRFHREARLAATLHHENIVDITDFGTDEVSGAPYLVMELLRGCTLMSVVRELGTMPWPRVAAILLQLSRALAAAHAQGILHRDLKPHNIMLVELSGRIDHVKLCDFGVSRLRNGDDRITITGNFIGTPAYMAPEQIRGVEQDERCDLYALGVTAYEMLTGRLPYVATTPVALVAEILSDRRAPLRESFAGELPAPLVSVIERCLSTDPANRPDSALAIERELLAISACPSPAVTDLVGHVIGRYRVIAPLGSGGSGSVWLAEHPVIGTKVAIKILRPEVLSAPDATERFINEARASSLIPSEHIARYLDLGWLPSGQPYAILEYLAGETLFERMERTVTFSIGDAVAIARQIASALVQAHAAGIVHRDIKPANVFLATSGSGVTAKVLDFGIAKLSREAAGGPQTAIGYFMGTVAYCPPEQIFGEPIGPGADVYALGTTLFEMLAGRTPFTGEATEIATAKTTLDAPSLAEARADAPHYVVALVRQMLARSERARPSMVEVFERLTATPPTDRTKVGPQPISKPHAYRAAWLLALIPALLIAVWRLWPSAAASPPPSSVTAAPIVDQPAPARATPTTPPTAVVVPDPAVVPTSTVAPQPKPISGHTSHSAPKGAPSRTKPKTDPASPKPPPSSGVIIADPFEAK